MDPSVERPEGWCRCAGVLTKRPNPHPVAAGGLPPGWMAALDRARNMTYFYNAGTGERSWTRPAAPAAPLPPGWSEGTDPRTGVAYFYNASTGARQWARPGLCGVMPASLCWANPLHGADRLPTLAPSRGGVCNPGRCSTEQARTPS